MNMSYMAEKHFSEVVVTFPIGDLSKIIHNTVATQHVLLYDVPTNTQQEAKRILGVYHRVSALQTEVVNLLVSRAIVQL